jgi:hypothetical protein
MSHVLYASVLGRMIYEMVCARSNITHAVEFLRKYMSKLGREHWVEIKKVFMYLHGTTTYALSYEGRP